MFSKVLFILLFFVSSVYAQDIESLIKNLGDNKFIVRKESYLKLKSMRGDIKDKLQNELKIQKDVEIKSKIEQLLYDIQELELIGGSYVKFSKDRMLFSR